MKPSPTQEPDAADELLSLGKRLCCLVWRLIWTFCKWMLENVLIFIACLLALALTLASGLPGLLVALIVFLGLFAEKKPGDADEKQGQTQKRPPRTPGNTA
jgi:hypothetical protein